MYIHIHIYIHVYVFYRHTVSLCFPSSLSLSRELFLCLVVSLLACLFDYLLESTGHLEKLVPSRSQDDGVDRSPLHERPLKLPKQAPIEA